MKYVVNLVLDKVLHVDHSSGLCAVVAGSIAAAKAYIPDAIASKTEFQEWEAAILAKGKETKPSIQSV